MYFKYILILLIKLTVSQVLAQPIPTLTLEAYKRIDKPARNEVSGITKSRTYENTFWVHGDSGTPDRIYAINQNGGFISNDKKYSGAKVKGAKNIDWEDIALGENGTLVLADIGNNCKCRNNLQILILEEPNPKKNKVEVLKKYKIQYPEREDWLGRLMKWNYDAEAVFQINDIIYVLTKQPRSTNLFKLENPVEGEVNKLIFIDSMNTENYVTAADVSRDGSHIAILTYNQVFIVDFSDRLLPKSKHKTAYLDGVDQIESVTFDGDRLIIAEETGHLYKVKLDQLVEINQKD